MTHVEPTYSDLSENTAQSIDGERTRLKKAIFDALIGFCTANTVHSRTIA